MDYGILGGRIPPPILEGTIEETHNGSLKPLRGAGYKGGGHHAKRNATDAQDRHFFRESLQHIQSLQR